MDPLECRVRLQLPQPVDMDGRRLGPRCDDDEVAVPGLELLEEREQLFALGAPLGTPDALLRLSACQLECLDLCLGRVLRLGSTFGDARQERLGSIRRLEPR